MRVSLITPGHNVFLPNFVSVTESHSVLLISVNNVLFIQIPKLETLKSFWTPLSSEILMLFGWNYCQFCFRPSLSPLASSRLNYRKNVLAEFTVLCFLLLQPTFTLMLYFFQRKLSSTPCLKTSSGHCNCLQAKIEITCLNKKGPLHSLFLTLHFVHPKHSTAH